MWRKILRKPRFSHVFTSSLKAKAVTFPIPVVTRRHRSPPRGSGRSPAGAELYGSLGPLKGHEDVVNSAISSKNQVDFMGFIWVYHGLSEFRMVSCNGFIWKVLIHSRLGMCFSTFVTPGLGLSKEWIYRLQRWFGVPYLEWSNWIERSPNPMTDPWCCYIW